ncbi:c-type cytochrome [Rubrivivax rivuli]|uniref:C-type cytochrome n=1 Tax=Rubrivivax rivuli TaxID=1862385 RepID=A0A437RIC4_9BURK|nr:c-type cytochrome [Rubrivivax rivuli]RVU46530.1 c-type cytochrome [Rubrivivax rivuli]
MANSPRNTVAQGLLLLVWACAGGAAQASPELAKQKNCMNCHAADRKIVGPAWRDIAKRYGSTPNASAALAVKIRAGGGGAWGVVPMPANPTLSEADAKRLADWVLTHR